MQDKKYRCQILESTEQVELGSNMTEVTFKLSEGRMIRVLFHECERFKNHPPSIEGLAQQEWSDLRADTGTLFLPDKIQMKHSQTQLHEEESLFFDQGMLVAHLATAVVCDDVAQEAPYSKKTLVSTKKPFRIRHS